MKSGSAEFLILLANSVRSIGCGHMPLILCLNVDFLGQFWVQMVAHDTVSGSLLNSPSVSLLVQHSDVGSKTCSKCA